MERMVKGPATKKGQIQEEEVNRSNPELKEMGRRMVEMEREINEWQNRVRRSPYRKSSC